MKNGIYHGMDEDEYHAIPRLSASGVKNILVSPMTFWSRSWLNTNKEENDENKFLLKGRAYHARVCEGFKHFSERYVYALDKKGYPDALDSGDQLKQKCKDLGLKVSGKKDELIARIKEVEQNTQIWSDIVSAHALANAGKTILPANWVHDIEVGANYIGKHPTIKDVFDGGEAETTILWTHTFSDRNGVERSVDMKSRIDYRKKNILVDFKTYSNALDFTPKKAIIREMSNRSYYLQAAVYYLADRAIDPDSQRVFMFVFQGTGDDKMPRCRMMGEDMGWITHGKTQFTNACEIYADAVKRFGNDPWLIEEEPEAFADEDFPPWMGE